MSSSRRRRNENAEQLHRHACHALEDFDRLRCGRDGKLWHSLSHHLRHTVFRSGLEVPARVRRLVRRSRQ
jgi:hypothetical protein